MHRYKNIRTGESIEFPDPQPSFAQHEDWQPEHVEAGRIDDGAPDLRKLKRDELNALAAERGVENPEDLPNAGAVIEAIEAEGQ